jgi:DNA-3-methyladenine glycosylase
MKALSALFFNRPTLKVARDLIGCYLVRGREGKKERYMITEAEAYDGPNDLACHAAGGKRTKRNSVLFGKPRLIYIYFTYGMHWLLNFVTGPKGYPAGVLIRGIETASGKPINGPARITKKLGLDGSFHGKPAIEATGLWVEEGESIPKNRIKRAPRIGVGYAGLVWTKKKYRFVLKTGRL